MAKRNPQPAVKKVKQSLSELSLGEIVEIDEFIHDRLETQAMMKLAESGFAEWDDPEEDLYNDQV